MRRGKAAITDSMSLDILDPDKLEGASVGEGGIMMKVKEGDQDNLKFDKFERSYEGNLLSDYTFEGPHLRSSLMK